MNYSQRMNKEFTDILNSYTRCGKVSRITKAKSLRLIKAFRYSCIGRNGKCI